MRVFMKYKWYLITTMCMTAMFIYFAVIKPRPTLAEPLDTYHSSWHLVRETANEDAATFAAEYDLTTEGNFANKDSSTVLAGGPFKISSQAIGRFGEGYSPGSKWAFVICGKNYDVGADNTIDNTFNFSIVGWSKTNGMLQVIADGNGILGTQAVIVYPDGGACVGDDVTATGLAYTHADETFTGTASEFDGMAVSMVAYVTAGDANLTSGYYAITTYTDVNTIIMSGISSTANSKLARVEVNPAFWADTIVLDETTKWTSTANEGVLAVLNSGSNEAAVIVIGTAGLEWIQFVFYDCDGATGIQAGNITVYGKRY